MTEAQYLAGIVGVALLGAMLWGAGGNFQRSGDPLTVQKVIRVKDGDTFDAILRGGSEPVTIRCASFDARESDEKGGPEATEALKRLLANAREIRLSDPKRDKYGRTAALVWVDGTLAGAKMVGASMTNKARGGPEFAVPWRGSRDKSWGRTSK